MIFIETAVFTRRVTELMNHDAYLGLRVALMFNPCVGDVIEGTGPAKALLRAIHNDPLHVLNALAL